MASLLTRHELITRIAHKLARRRHLNEPDVRRARCAMTPAPQGIHLTFAEAEAVLTALRAAQATAQPPSADASDPHAQLPGKLTTREQKS